MAAGVWDGIDKERVGRGLVTAFMSDEYLEVLADINNAETRADVLAAREKIKGCSTPHNGCFPVPLCAL